MSHPIVERLRSHDPHERAAACMDSQQDPSAARLVEHLGQALGDLMAPWIKPLPGVASSELLETTFAGELLARMADDPWTCAERYNEAVRALPARQAQAIALHYLEDRSVADIAEILECSESTVKVHLHKGRTKLARRFSATGEVTE